MTKKTIQLVSLIIGSLLSIGTVSAAIFVGANIINDITISQFEFSTVLLLLILLISVGSVIYAWFNKKVGGVLIAMSSITIILFNYFDFEITEFYWQQGGLLLMGLLLLHSAFYNERKLGNSEV